MLDAVFQALGAERGRFEFKFMPQRYSTRRGKVAFAKQ